MKNIIVAGVSRAGKSNLAKKVAAVYQMTYIPFDSIVSALENLYPQLGIAHMDENIKMSRKIAEFLKEFIRHLEYEDISYVLDLYQVFPTDLKKVYSDDTHVAVYLGYSSLTAEEKLVFVRRHSRDKDWTKQVDDEKMTAILNLFVEESRLMQKQCTVEGVEFFDTGLSYEDALDNAYEYIASRI